jgi:hypothetical protein
MPLYILVKHLGSLLFFLSRRFLQRGHSFGFGTLGVQVWPQKGHLQGLFRGLREGSTKNKSPTVYVWAFVFAGLRIMLAKLEAAATFPIQKQPAPQSP